MAYIRLTTSTQEVGVQKCKGAHAHFLQSPISQANCSTALSWLLFKSSQLFHLESSLLWFKPHYLLCDTFSTAEELQKPFIKYLKTTIMSLLQTSLGSTYLQESTLWQCSEIFSFSHRSEAISKRRFRENCIARIRRRQHRMLVQNSKCFFWENISIVLLQRHA